ncbi:MAG: hypothetical protein C9356_15000 [Oleiphilus sp.]|nr:MAG: hypothetical protein C9356_15000 [Oleiphilus sp.]
MTQRMALLLEQHQGLDARSCVHVTCHPLVGEERTTIGAGKVLDKQALRGILDILVEGQTSELVFLPRRLIAKSANTLIWYRKASANTEIRFLGGKTGAIDLSVAVPNLLFCLHAGRLWVFAYKGRGAPDLDTPLYRAPFGNINDHGFMCVGANHLPEFPDIAEIERVEEMFFQSEFSEVHGSSPIKGVDNYDAMVAFYQGLVGAKCFPTRRLRMCGFDGKQEMMLEEVFSLCQ